MGMQAIAKVAKKATEGQKKVEPAVRKQRAYGKGQLKAAGATGLTAAALSAMSLKELREELKKAETEAEQAKIKAAIEKTLRQMVQEESKSKDKKKDMMRGGMARKKPAFKAGGYANCGASMKATQKSTKMMRGGMVRK